MTAGQVVDAPLSDLKPHPRNPRKITPARLDQLKATLVAEPEMLRARPLIALADGTVVAGNQRLAAAEALGWETIPTVYAELTREQETRWMLLDNRGFGEDVAEDAAALLAELEQAGSDVAPAGYDPREVEKLLALTRTTRTDADDAPDRPNRPRSKDGQVYELGPHLLMCGDATDPDQTRALFAPPGHHGLDRVDCIWTDPPYGVEYVGKTKDALTIDNDVSEGLADLIGDALLAVTPGLAAHCRFYIAGPAGPRAVDFLTAIAGRGWRLHQILVWRKHRLVLGHSDYHYQHEFLFYGWATSVSWPGRPGHGAHGGSCWYGGNDQTSVFDVDAPQRSAEHPTMKPVELIERCLINSTQRNAVVYDAFGGSGSTMIACENLGRRARLMELDPGYCDVIRKRYADYTGRPELAP